MKNFFFEELRLKGVGYKTFVVNSKFFLKIGYSHYISVPIPFGLQIVSKKDKIILFGTQKIVVFQFARILYELRKPDVYRGKGIFFVKRPPVLKVGKQR